MRSGHTLTAIATATLLTLGSALLPARMQARQAATPGVTPTSILVGDSLPQSGPAAAYSVIAGGEQAYFSYVNAHGGIFGRKLTLTALDDGYDPTRSLSNVKNLVLSKGVFALLGDLGTANNLATLSFITQQKVPLVYPATGSSLMFKPFQKYLFPLQLNYTTEGKILADYAVKQLHARKIGVFYQNDDFGKEGLDAVTAQAAKDGAAVTDSESYQLTDTDLSPQALKLQQAGVDAVIIYAVPGPFATFVGTAAKVGLKATLLSSSVGADNRLIASMGPVINGVYFSGYAPPVTGPDPQAVFMRSVLKQYGDPKTAPVDSFTEAGFGAAQVFVEGLRRAGPNLTRAGFIKALETIRNYNGSLYGHVTYTPTSHEGVRGGYIALVRKNAEVVVTGYQSPK
ncbi:MAG TPA: ABC transporter substrate-binding protein [Chloroflexota bacterium]|nr:ABC transporter substrate-binding protein [Chloroflexota bacterium]